MGDEAFSLGLHCEVDSSVRVGTVPDTVHTFALSSPRYLSH